MSERIYRDTMAALDRVCEERDKARAESNLFAAIADGRAEAAARATAKADALSEERDALKAQLAAARATETELRRLLKAEKERADGLANQFVFTLTLDAPKPEPKPAVKAGDWVRVDDSSGMLTAGMVEEIWWLDGRIDQITVGISTIRVKGNDLKISKIPAPRFEVGDWITASGVDRSHRIEGRRYHDLACEWQYLSPRLHFGTWTGISSDWNKCDPPAPQWTPPGRGDWVTIDLGERGERCVAVDTIYANGTVYAMAHDLTQETEGKTWRRVTR